ALHVSASIMKLPTGFPPSTSKFGPVCCSISMFPQRKTATLQIREQAFTIKERIEIFRLCVPLRREPCRRQSRSSAQVYPLIELARLSRRKPVGLHDP